MLNAHAVISFGKEVTDYLRTNIDIALTKVPISYELLFSLALIFFISFIFILITKRKLEFIPLYIISGIIIGPIGFGLIKNTSIIHLLSEVGIAFLLFVAGMEISVSKLKDTTKDAFKLGIIQVAIIFLLSFFAFYFLKLKIYEIIYISFILALSSTVVIVKIMTDKKELNTLHARLLLGILVLQDILAIIFLTLFRENTISFHIIFYFFNFILLILLALIFKRYFIEKLLDFSSKNQELLLIFALSLLFVFSLLSLFLGLSIIIGAFIAGIVIADSSYKVEIEGRIKPLRDFFALIFFVALGMQLSSVVFKEIWLPFLIILALMFIVKPLAIYFLSEVFGYKRTTSFAIALPLANLSEFGLIIALQGFYLGHISDSVFNLITLSTIIGMAISPYLIKNHYAIYKRFSNFLLLKLGNEKKLEYKSPQKERILLIGCHRMGSIILEKLKQFKNKIFVIDHNPDIIKALIKKKITCIYGDASNLEVLERVNWNDIEVIISTLPNYEINEFLITYAKSRRNDIIFIATAEKIHDAIKLYKRRADFVILPQTIAGSKVSDFVEKIMKKKKKGIEKFRKEQIEWLEKIHRLLY